MFDCMRPTMLSPIVSPTKCCDVHDTELFQVPHIHPSHTTYHHHKIFEHLHTFPHTVSNVSDVSHQHFNCGGSSCGVGPMPGMGPGFAPGVGPGFAPGMGPGFAPGMAPGFAPGMGMMPPPGAAPFFRP